MIQHLSKANSDRIPEIQKFMFDIIKDDFGYEYTPERHKDIDNIKKLYTETDRNGLWYICDTQGNICGTIAGRTYDKTYTFLQDRYPNSTHIFSLRRHYISKELRRKGLGSELLQQAETFALQNNYTTIYTHTQKNIPGSLSYWLKHGYISIWESDDELETVHLEKKIA